MGVDYDPLKVEPIRAIGAGTIVGIGSWGMYGAWFDYRLAGGRFAGKCIYVAEHIGSILKPGTRFRAGDTIATAYPGPYWTEWGWAKGLTPPQCPGRSAAAPNRTTSTLEVAPSLASCAAWAQRPCRTPGPGRCMRAGRADAMPLLLLGDHRRLTSFCARRLALTAVAAALVVVAEALATLSVAAPHTPHPRRTAAAHRASKPYGGEPQPSQNSITSNAPWIAAVTFVRDYAAWQADRLKKTSVARRHRARTPIGRARRTASLGRDKVRHTVGPHGRLRRRSIPRHKRGRQLPDRPTKVAVVGCIDPWRLARLTGELALFRSARFWRGARRTEWDGARVLLLSRYGYRRCAPSRSWHGLGWSVPRARASIARRVRIFNARLICDAWSPSGEPVNQPGIACGGGSPGGHA